MDLGIVQRLVKLLHAKRGPGRHSLLTLAHTAPQPVAHAADAGPGVRQPQARVLLVGDDPAVLNITRILLRNEGHQVTTVLSMANALRQAASDPRIDLLVTEHHLGKETGVQVIAALRELLGRPLKAVLITSQTSWDIAGLPGDPLVRFAIKPVNIEQLLSLVGELLDHSPDQGQVPR